MQNNSSVVSNHSIPFGGFTKLVNFEIVGLIYDFVGTIIWGIFYKPTILSKGYRIKIGDEFVSQPVALPSEWTEPVMYLGLSLIMLGFLLLLIGAIKNQLTDIGIFYQKLFWSIPKAAMISLLFIFFLLVLFFFIDSHDPFVLFITFSSRLSNAFYSLGENNSFVRTFTPILEYWIIATLLFWTICPIKSGSKNINKND